MVLKDALQNRYLEQDENYLCNFNDHMDCRRRNPPLL
jgi:hypothetical protein